MQGGYGEEKSPDDIRKDGQAGKINDKMRENDFGFKASKGGKTWEKNF